MENMDTTHPHGHGDHHHHRDHGGDHLHKHEHDDHHHHHEDMDAGGYWRGQDGKLYHSHDGLAPHTHEPLESPGFFIRRAQRLNRDFRERAFTVGIGGPVGSGKTALMLALCIALRDKYSIAAVTNDIFTREDGEFLVKHGALAPERIRAIETGGCPHAAIREDISINLGPLEDLSRSFSADILLCESGGGKVLAFSLPPTSYLKKDKLIAADFPLS